MTPTRNLPWAAPAWVWFTPALWLATVWACIDLIGQRDAALSEMQALRPRLQMAERSLAACRDQNRALASRPVTICQPPEPCLSLGERIQAVWEGR